MTEKKIVDYLDEDPEITSQKFVLLSFVTPYSVKNVSINEDVKTPEIRGIKVRGCFSTKEDATKRAEFLRKIDPYINIYVGDVGKWLPFEDDQTKAEEIDYAEQKLQDLMKAYKEEQLKAKEYNELKRRNIIEQSIKEAEKVKEKQKQKQIPFKKEIEEINKDSEDIKVKEEALKQITKELEDAKKIRDEARTLTEELIKQVNSMKK